jgi:hypothetical protein
MEESLKTLKLALCLGVVLFLVAGAWGQQIDVAFGAGTLSSPSSNLFSTNFAQFQQSLRGGTFLTFSGDALIKGNLGVQGEVSWRASRTNYAGFLPYRPLFWDFNAIYAPRFNKFIGAEVMAGIGAESARFYTGQYTCNYFSGCSNYQSSNHFMGDFGGGLKLYPVGNFFIRPEARLYLINNNQEFSSGRAVRYGMSIGYTFGGKMF